MGTTEAEITRATIAARGDVTALVLAGPTGEHEHDGGARHPEQPARLVAVMEGVAALGSAVRGGDDPRSPRPHRGTGPGARPGLPDRVGGLLHRGRRCHRRRHLRAARLVAGGATSGRSRAGRPDRARASPRRRGVRAGAAPRTSCDGGSCHGFLPAQLHRRRGRLAYGPRRARVDRRLGRAPRERDPGHLLGRPRRVLCLDPPAPPLPGDGTGQRGGRAGARRERR